ncbi:flavin monoamine oxidase family protein [Mycolicibacterium fortuitum]|uniref:flavin monoamine oxidase family protein n=1 Tax=Mycolicibacterium fortuitum TaxID=1766 RepID=UPI00096E131C|nr:NAD(P)/FAD-dependent oxidoreductase [Mycolicibacterium fortuitum]OMC07457.1 oxidase [Mycolicibacterium fortuitum]
MTAPKTVREETTRVAVIGAGMSGLMAATTLSAQVDDIVVLEAADRAGGRVETVRQGDYWINVGTQFTEGTGPLIEALDRHGVARGSLAGKGVALGLHGEVIDTSNPVQLMFSRGMTFVDRIGMAVVGARVVSGAVALGLNPDGAIGRRIRASLDRKPGSSLVRGVRSSVARAVVRAWAAQWMGCEPEETAATQFVYSVGIAIADPEKVPNFSLPVGGNQTLTDILAEDLGEKIRLGATVNTVEGDDDGVVIEYEDANGPVRLRAERAVVTVPADVARRILPGLPQSYRDAYDDIDYGRYVVVGFFTEESGERQAWDDFFAVSTPLLEFQAVFNHAAAQRGKGPRKPGGALACFAGGAKADALLDLPDEEIAERFSRDLVALYPQLKGKLGTPIVRKHHRVVPFWAPNKRASLPVLREPIGPIHLAGDFLLDVPSLADAAASGERAAKAVLTELGIAAAD